MEPLPGEQREEGQEKEWKVGREGGLEGRLRVEGRKGRRVGGQEGEWKVGREGGLEGKKEREVVERREWRDIIRTKETLQESCVL